MQHNRELRGGAKKTAKYDDWITVCHVRGFQTQKEALRFEWMWQHPTLSLRSRATIRDKVVGVRGVGSIGSVRRKMTELLWLVRLGESDLTVHLNDNLEPTWDADKFLCSLMTPTRLKRNVSLLTLQ